MDILQGISLFIPWIRKYFVRRDEIRYIRKLIIEERKKIYSMTAIQLPSSSIPVPADQIRVTLYQYMRSELTSALKERATKLSFDEKRSITHHLSLPDWILSQEKLPPFKVYKMMFSEWEKQKWLNLPAYEGEIPEE